MADMQIVVACKNVEAQYVEMMVPLYSHGCEKKVKRTLSHLKGIYSVKVDYKQQKVTVWGICNKYDVLAMVKSKRKATRFWNPQDNDNCAALEQVEDAKSAESLLSSTPPPSPPPPKHLRISKPSLRLTRSLSLKALKKVFTRSYSLS